MAAKNNHMNLVVNGHGGAAGGNAHFSLGGLTQLINSSISAANSKLADLKGSEEASIADMFQMQMLMNHLAQLSEMSTGIASAAHQATMSMARNVKG